MKRAGMRNQCYTCAHLYLCEGNDVGCDAAAYIFAGGNKTCPSYEHTDKPEMAGKRACCRCKEVKEERHFSRDKHFLGEWDCYCLDCRKEMRLQADKPLECCNSIEDTIRSLRRGQTLKVSGLTNALMRTYKNEVKRINLQGWAQWIMELDRPNKELTITRAR